MSSETQIRLEAPLILIPPKESPIGTDSNLALMDVDLEAVSESVAVDVGDPTSSDGRDVGLPPSLPSVSSPMHTPDGPTGLPIAKKRRVMFADE